MRIDILTILPVFNTRGAMQLIPQAGVVTKVHVEIFVVIIVESIVATMHSPPGHLDPDTTVINQSDSKGVSDCGDVNHPPHGQNKHGQYQSNLEEHEFNRVHGNSCEDVRVEPAMVK